MGKWFSATDGRILMIFRQTPWNFNSDEMLKKITLAHLWGWRPVCKKTHYAHCQLWPKCAINDTGGTFEQKTHTSKNCFLHICQLGNWTYGQNIQNPKNRFFSFSRRYSLLKLDLLCSLISPSQFWACRRAFRNASKQCGAKPQCIMRIEKSGEHDPGWGQHRFEERQTTFAALSVW